MLSFSLRLAMFFVLLVSAFIATSGATSATKLQTCNVYNPSQETLSMVWAANGKPAGTCAPGKQTSITVVETGVALIITVGQISLAISVSILIYIALYFNVASLIIVFFLLCPYCLYYSLIPNYTCVPSELAKLKPSVSVSID